MGLRVNLLLRVLRVKLRLIRVRRGGLRVSAQLTRAHERLGLIGVAKTLVVLAVKLDQVFPGEVSREEPLPEVLQACLEIGHRPPSRLRAHRGQQPAGRPTGRHYSRRKPGL